MAVMQSQNFKRSHSKGSVNQRKFRGFRPKRQRKNPKSKNNSKFRNLKRQGVYLNKKCPIKQITTTGNVQPLDFNERVRSWLGRNLEAQQEQELPVVKCIEKMDDPTPVKRSSIISQKSKIASPSCFDDVRKGEGSLSPLGTSGRDKPLDQSPLWDKAIQCLLEERKVRKHSLEDEPTQNDQEGHQKQLVLSPTKMSSNTILLEKEYGTEINVDPATECLVSGKKTAQFKNTKHSRKKACETPSIAQRLVQHIHPAQWKEFRKFYLKNSHNGYCLALKNFRKKKLLESRKVNHTTASSLNFQVKNVKDTDTVQNILKETGKVPLSIHMKQTHVSPLFIQQDSPIIQVDAKRFSSALTKASSHDIVSTTLPIEKCGPEHHFDVSSSTPVKVSDHEPKQARDVCYIFALLDKEKEETLLKCSPHMKSSQILEQLLSVIETITGDNDLMISKTSMRKDVSDTKINNDILLPNLISRGTSPVPFQHDDMKDDHCAPNNMNEIPSENNLELREAVENDGSTLDNTGKDTTVHNMDAALKVLISKAFLNFNRVLGRHVDICIRILCWCSGTIKGDIDSDVLDDELEGLLCHCHDQVVILLECLSIFDRLYVLNIDEAEVTRFWLLHDAVCCILQAYRCFRTPSLISPKKLLSLMTTCAKMIMPSDNLDFENWITLMKMVQEIGKAFTAEEFLPDVCKCHSLFMPLREKRNCRVCDVNHLYQEVCQVSDALMLGKGTAQVEANLVPHSTVALLFPRLCSFLEAVEAWSEKEFRSAFAVHSVLKFSCNKQSGLYPCKEHVNDISCSCFIGRHSPSNCVEGKNLSDVQEQQTAQRAGLGVMNSDNKSAEEKTITELLNKTNQPTNLVSSSDGISCDKTVRTSAQLNEEATSTSCRSKVEEGAPSCEGGEINVVTNADSRHDNLDTVALRSSAGSVSSSDNIFLHLDEVEQDLDIRPHHTHESLQTNELLLKDADDCDSEVEDITSKGNSKTDLKDNSNMLEKSHPNDRISEGSEDCMMISSSDSTRPVSSTADEEYSESIAGAIMSPSIDYSSLDFKQAQSTIQSAYSALSQDLSDVMSKPNSVGEVHNGSSVACSKKTSNFVRSVNLDKNSCAETPEWTSLSGNKDSSSSCEIQDDSQFSGIIIDNNSSLDHDFADCPISNIGNSSSIEVPESSSLTNVTKSVGRNRQGDFGNNVAQRQSKTESILPSSSTSSNKNYFEPRSSSNHDDSEQSPVRRVNKDNKVHSSYSSKSRLSLSYRSSNAQTKFSCSPKDQNERSFLSQVPQKKSKSKQSTNYGSPTCMQEKLDRFARMENMRVRFKDATAQHGALSECVQHDSQAEVTPPELSEAMKEAAIEQKDNLPNNYSDNKSILKMPNGHRLLKGFKGRVRFAVDGDAQTSSMKSSPTSESPMLKKRRKISKLNNGVKQKNSKDLLIQMGEKHHTTMVETEGKMKRERKSIKGGVENTQDKVSNEKCEQELEEQIDCHTDTCTVAQSQKMKRQKKKSMEKDSFETVFDPTICNTNIQTEKPQKQEVKVPVRKPASKGLESATDITGESASRNQIKKKKNAVRKIQKNVLSELSRDFEQEDLESIPRSNESSLNCEGFDHHIKEASQNDHNKQAFRGANDSDVDWKNYLLNLKKRLLD